MNMVFVEALIGVGVIYLIIFYCMTLVVPEDHVVTRLINSGVLVIMSFAIWMCIYLPFFGRIPSQIGLVAGN